jgi:phosphoribosyl 1,2-cyclic phosphodiesterase
MNIKFLASGSKGNCYIVNDGKSTLIIDAGIPFKKIQIGIGFKMSTVDGVLISHEHL